jgi:hypothetical protein
MQYVLLGMVVMKAENDIHKYDRCHDKVITIMRPLRPLQYLESITSHYNFHRNLLMEPLIPLLTQHTSVQVTQCQFPQELDSNCYVFFTILCLPYRLSLGPSSLLCHHPLHAQTLLILDYLSDSIYDSHRFIFVTHTTTDTSSIHTMTSS